ncbi:MAG: spore cortex biosynthesis protein YabQ [Acutalibacteraceae bacterium]
MVFTNGEQLYDLFLYAGFGFLLCLYNDLFRIRRRVSRPRPIALFCQDVFLCVSAFLMLFLFSLTTGGAQFRLLPLLSGVGGFVVARLTVSRLLMPAANAVIRFGRRCTKGLRRAGSALLRPLKSALCKAASFFCEKVRKTAKKVPFFSKKGLQGQEKIVYNQNRE